MINTFKISKSISRLVSKKYDVSKGSSITHFGIDETSYSYFFFSLQQKRTVVFFSVADIHPEVTALLRKEGINI